MPGPFAENGKCQEFVANLKRMRDLFGWSQEDLAVHAHVGKGTVAMTESFQRAPQVDHGMAYDGAFGLKDMFTAQARVIQGKPYAEAFQDFPAHEATADDLYFYENSVFPGLIQTKRYMRAVFEAVLNVTADEIDRLVAGRVARQEAVYRDDPKPPRLWALVDEAALRRPVAAPDVMYEQCMHALAVSRLPHVSLAVVPYAARWHVGLLGSGHIVERDGIPRIVNVEDITDGRVSEDPVTVRRVALCFRSLQHKALPGGDSQDLIVRMAEELWNEKATTGARALAAVATAERA
jgi:transcriptional regulator with XRE-family HTH domain